MATISSPLRLISWICRIAVPAILLQPLYFKFSGAPESIYIFTKLGVDPWGRYASGVVELFAALLLLFPRTTWAGALLASGVMLGAVGGHLARLGIVVQNDGGLLFVLAVIVLTCALVTAYIHRHQIPVVGDVL